ncbi:MAG: low temperature requirement protein A [Aeromicrobium sp.]
MWGFGHYVIFAAAAAFGAGLAARVEYYEHHADVSDIVSSAFVSGPVAAFLAASWSPACGCTTHRRGR